MRSFDTPELRELNRKHHFYPFSDHTKMYKKGRRIITGAENNYIYDCTDNRYLDGMSEYGASILAEVDPSLSKLQMEQLPYCNSFFHTSQLPAIELAEVLAQLTPPLFNRVFLDALELANNQRNQRNQRKI